MNGSLSAPVKFREACLTCPMFLTTAEFLPQHHQQRQQTLQLIAAAEARGHNDSPR